MAACAQPGSLRNGQSGLFWVVEPWPSADDPVLRLHLFSDSCVPVAMSRCAGDVQWVRGDAFQHTAASVGSVDLGSACETDRAIETMVFCDGIGNTEVTLVSSPAVPVSVGSPDCTPPSLSYSIESCSVLSVALHNIQAQGRLVLPYGYGRDVIAALPGVTYGEDAAVPLPSPPGWSCADAAWGFHSYVWVPRDERCDPHRFFVDTTPCRDPILYTLVTNDPGPTGVLVLWTIVSCLFVVFISSTAYTAHPIVAIFTTSLYVSFHVPMVSRVGFSPVAWVAMGTLCIPYLWWAAVLCVSLCSGIDEHFTVMSKDTRTGFWRATVYALVQCLVIGSSLSLKR